jgi:Helix-hairpin-helix motif
MESTHFRHNLRTRDSGVSSRFSGWWLRSVLICVLSSGLSLVGCSTDDHKQNADELREKTAQATAELKRNAKSVAEGVKEGWSRDQDKERVDLNSATREQLVGTGLNRTQSDRVIEHRPYANPRELLTKHVLSKDEYKQIEPHVRAGDPSDN